MRMHHWALFSLIIAMCCQLFDAQWDGVGTGFDTKKLLKNKKAPILLRKVPAQ